MLGVLLRRQGWPVAYLGQNVPLADLADFVRQIHPGEVSIGGDAEEPARALADWSKWMTQENGKPQVSFGGRAFVVQPELKGLVEGVYLGDTIRDGMGKMVNG